MKESELARAIDNLAQAVGSIAAAPGAALMKRASAGMKHRAPLSKIRMRSGATHRARCHCAAMHFIAVHAVPTPHLFNKIGHKSAIRADCTHHENGERQ